MMTMLMIVSGAAWALDLAEARQIATTRSLSVERAAATAAVSQAGYLGQLSGNLPSVAGFADVSTGAGLTSFGFPRPVQNQMGIGVQASWTLLAPSDWAAATAARHTAAGQEAMARWAMVSARQDATAAYARALSAQQEQAAWERATEDAVAAQEAAEALVSAGLRPPADAARARADAAAARASALEAGGRARARCAELRGMLRMAVDGPCDLQPVPWGEPEAAEVSEHPALTAAREAERAARRSLNSAQLAWAPTATITSTAAEYNVGDGFGFGWSAGVGVDLPLFASGVLTQAARAAARQLEVSEADLEAQQIDLDIARASADAQLEASRAGLVARQVALEAAEAAYALEDARYREGLSGATDWLAARRQRDQAAAALAIAEAAVGEALAAAEAARGVW